MEVQVASRYILPEGLSTSEDLYLTVFNDEWIHSIFGYISQK